MTAPTGDNIAIAVETSADLTGTQAARHEVSALAQEATAATEQMAQGAVQAAAGQETLAAATAKASAQADAGAASANKASSSLTTLGKAGADAGARAGAGLAGVAGDAQTLASSVNIAIGEFEAFGQAVDVTSLRAVQAYRQQGDALAANLAKLGATDAEINRIGTSIARVERAAGASLVPIPPEDVQRLEVIPGKARTGANSLAILTQAALAGQGSLAGMATAAGGLATGLAGVTDNAKLAAGAAGIGALITVGVLLYETYKRAKDEIVSAASPEVIAHLGHDTLTQAKKDLANYTKLRDQAQQEAAQKATGTILDLIPHTAAYEAEKHYETLARNVEEATKRVLELEHAERIRAIELAQSARDEIANNRRLLQLEQDRAAHKKNDYQLSLEQNETERRQRAAEIEQQFRHRDANGQIVALTAEEVRLRDQLLAQNDAIARAKGLQLQYDYQIALQTATAQRLEGSDNAAERVRGRLEEIELERQAEIQKTGDVYNANLNAEQKKRQLYRDTAAAANDAAKSIFDVLRSSNEKTLKAVGTFGESFRRIVIGADAARALVKAAHEGAEAIASLAAGDFRGAALHGAAALEFGKAAALGAQESLGAGGGGGAGSGGVASTNAGSATFAPNAPQGGAAVIVNLLTTNPYTGENVATTSYYLNRQGLLNRPIYVPPTTGLMPAGV
ncbi:MAG TPA: hypothetical protein VHB25_08590 [Gemmatimonadaceae bacterium]|nr:hypothetical protein [Gemmatimonadaceae bacterium]